MAKTFTDEAESLPADDPRRPKALRQARDLDRFIAAVGKVAKSGKYPQRDWPALSSLRIPKAKP